MAKSHRNVTIENSRTAGGRTDLGKTTGESNIAGPAKGVQQRMDAQLRARRQDARIAFRRAHGRWPSSLREPIV